MRNILLIIMADIYYPAISGDSFIDSKILDAYDKTTELEKNIKNQEEVFKEIAEGAGGDPCETIEKTIKMGEVIKNITNMISSTSGTIKLFDGFQNYIAMQVILKRLQLCLLYAKRLVYIIKLKIAEISKKLLIDMISGKGSAIPDPISSAVNAAFMTLGTVIQALLTVIDTFLNIISTGMLGVDAQGMTFFLTPKSMNMTKVSVYNSNSAIADRLPQPIQMVLFEIGKTVERANAAIKKAALVAGAAAGAVSILSDNPTFGISEKLSHINPGQVQKLIDAAEDINPLPLGLPRYEKLKFTNLGFLVFLVTGFEPAAHSSFGIPGYF